ncbi:hypothetical protein L1049_008817 [Liquidambar formosana]|uniref:Protein FAR1-RELATED SEQUENCE n=1 Tax=Liquidambar formosana TaxID=63359 RepID=A0AAP0SBB3_LIQFO
MNILCLNKKRILLSLSPLRRIVKTSLRIAFGQMLPLKRHAYKFFGDVVIFDTTYNTNKYGLIFAPIVGVNNHWQTVMFGCAFLSGETTDSFVWLFEQFLKAMPASPPKMIITDQDPAMSNAIAQLFPNALHRYCSWHILNKFSEKLNAISLKVYYEDFKKCIWNSESNEEFESDWLNIIQKCDFQDNGWLNTMYGLRERWVPAYVRHVFSAGMSSSQRAESNHAFFKRFVNKKNSLMDFVTRFNRGVAHQRHEELISDHVDKNEKPELKTPLLMEKQMADIYTRTIFLKFQDELCQCFVYVLTKKGEDQRNFIYEVKNEGLMEGNKKEKVRELLVDKSLGLSRCSCKNFECEGWPCRHMLSYFNRNQILQLPSDYILVRWTKTARLEKVVGKGDVEVQNSCENSLLVRRNTLCQIANRVIDDALASEEYSEALREHLLSFHANIKTSVGTGGSGGGVLSKINHPREPIYNDPSQVRAKGCGKRLRGGKEISKNSNARSRKCNGCNKTGQSHDKRNCPSLMDA